MHYIWRERERDSRRRSSCLYGWIKQPQPRVFIYLSLFDRLASADIKRPYISDDYSWCFNSFLLLTAIWNNIKNKNKIKKVRNIWQRLIPLRIYYIAAPRYLHTGSEVNTHSENARQQGLLMTVEMKWSYHGIPVKDARESKNPCHRHRRWTLASNDDEMTPNLLARQHVAR